MIFKIAYQVCQLTHFQRVLKIYTYHLSCSSNKTNKSNKTALCSAFYSCQLLGRHQVQKTVCFFFIFDSGKAFHWQYRAM